MIYFRDMTFCKASSYCGTKECPRQFDDKQQRAADQWWSGMKGDPPIAFADFSGSCPMFLDTRPVEGEATE